jgi:hypothetical protein
MEVSTDFGYTIGRLHEPKRAYSDILIDASIIVELVINVGSWPNWPSTQSQFFVVGELLFDGGLSL